MDDPDRTLILARRARFVAQALAAAGLAGLPGCGPKPCLSQVAPTEVVVPNADAGTEPETDADALPGRDGGAPEPPPPRNPEVSPQICLSEL